MKKYVFFLFLTLSALSTLACDICGCGNGSSFFGILPQGHRRFLGVRYRYASFDSHIGSLNLQTREQFRTAELWGRFYPTKRLQVLGFVPYQFGQQTMLKTGSVTPLQGLGDVSAMAQYNLLNTFMQDSAARTIDHNLLIGGGVKLPTGRYRYDANSNAEVANPNFQLGTGSVDYLFTAIHTVRYKQWGLNTDLSYRLAGTNSNGYRFGNRLTGSLSAFYLSSVGPKAIMPNVGVFVEQAQRDRQHGIQNSRTGGYATYLSAGTEVYLNKLSLGVSYRHPLAQKLANGEIRANAQLSTHLTFLF
ncbi:hypothetical protein [Spirosoma montaniterrae]|uniref:Transporter n=1 Tax=Spirosoma montaniterrae TaxID=1178516 RepID=A0A1P9WWN8_9BACT|nr:hypothetical protein [Spirosoma montaniterrae]AQG79807.1 hypothetical protein AWR27_11015 [Spirosoma montaniterrae]